MKKTCLLGAIVFCQISLASDFVTKFVEAAHFRTEQNITYDGSYFSMSYPNGDVPKHLGVCTDVVIRSYRSLGIDLQKLIHEDISLAFKAYPAQRIWGQKSPDKNIDHRRVPNLQVFFERHGNSLPVSKNFKDYVAGDLVTWMLPGNLPHIGIVSDKISTSNGHPLLIHNIGRGPELRNMLFQYPVTGHYRFHVSVKD